MRDTAEIEVRWTTTAGKKKSVVFKHGSRISKIVLDGPERPDTAVPEDPEFLAVRDVAEGDGPFVCYEINGQLHCW